MYDIILHASSEADILSALDAAGLSTSYMAEGVSVIARSGPGWDLTPASPVYVPTGNTVDVDGGEVPEYVTLPGVYATLRLSGADVDVSSITAANPPAGVPGFGPLPAPVPTPPREIHVAWFKAALADMGKLDAVDTAVATLPATKQVMWEYATSINETDTDVIATAKALKINLAKVFDRAETIRTGKLSLRTDPQPIGDA
jgi:hypothetical protein